MQTALNISFYKFSPVTPRLDIVAGGRIHAIPFLKVLSIVFAKEYLYAVFKDIPIEIKEEFITVCI